MNIIHVFTLLAARRSLSPIPSTFLLRGRINLGVEVLLGLHGVGILVGGSGVALGVVEHLTAADRVLETLNLV